jgi:hypothetical protein
MMVILRAGAGQKEMIGQKVQTYSHKINKF